MIDGSRICPECKLGSMYVVETRYNENAKAIKRRRKCNKCGFTQTSYELEAEEYQKIMDCKRRINKAMEAMRNVWEEE